MKQHLFRRLSAAACALTLALSLLPAARAAETPAKSSNINGQDYTTYGTTVKSYLYENQNGGLTRVEYTGGKVVVEDYDSAYHLQSSRTVPMELSIWGGFYAGGDCNFLIFGQDNPGESDSVEVIRVVKYSKDWQRLGQASLKGANTTVPFDAGSLRCDEYGGYLYIRTCHEMYKYTDGINHQSNLTMAVRESDMAVTDAYYGIWNTTYGYVSHSFNQYLLVDEDGKIVTLDHGDANPRSVVFMKYYADAGTGKFSGQPYGTWCSAGNMMTFAGASGNNTTGGSVGGLAETRDGYVMTYSYDGAGGTGDRCVYYHYMDKASGKSWSYQLTTTPGATTPVLASAGLEGGYVMWNGKRGYTVDDTLYYVAYTADGEPGEIQTGKAPLSDCQPIAYNGKVVWYVTDDSTPIFYTLDESGVTSHTVSGTSPAVPETPAQPENPAAPGAPSAAAEGIMTSPDSTFLIPGLLGAAITSDGTLRSWYMAALDGKTVESEDYTPHDLLEGCRSVTDCYVLKKDGTLWLYWDGEIDTLTKVMDNVEQVSGGTVLKKDGTVWSTIAQTEGVSRADTFYPITSGAKQVYSSAADGTQQYAYVVKEDGSLWSWGCNDCHMLGRDTGGKWGALGKVMDNVAYVTGGMAIKTDGTLWSWGDNAYGQVGNGSISFVTAPVKILDNVTGIWSHGAYDSNAGYRFAVTADGELYSWGCNSGWNPLGYEGGNEGYDVEEFGYVIYRVEYQTVPRRVGVSQVVSVDTDSYTTVILKTDGSLWAYGRNVDLPITGDGDGLERLTVFTKFLDGVKIPGETREQSGSASAGSTTQKPASSNQPSGSTPQNAGTATQPSGGTAQQPAASRNPFTDVPEGSYYHDAVLWAYENGITTGVTATQFQPGAACTRGQVVTFLWRAKGCPEPEIKVNPFTDVKSSSPFYKAILWAYENGITTGTTASTFNPGGTCTSAHVITFLWRANDEPAAAGNSTLAGANPGRYYTDAVAWADSDGLLSGTGKDFVPGAQSPRADIVTYLYRDLAA